MKRNVKRFVSMILAIMMVATFTVNAFAASFIDVGESRWSYNAVEYCAEKGYMAGVGKSTFDPNGKVTRAMVAQTLWNRKGKTPPMELTHFNDVASDAWYASAVNWCKEQDVVSGVGGGKFNPNSSVTRGDFCLMLYNFANKYHTDKVDSSKYTTEYAMTYLDEVSSKGYKDADSWHAQALAWAYETKLISGSGKDANGKAVLDSRGTCTREQLAQFLMNFDTQVLGDKVEEPVERKCEHGNDPDTCPICHPAEPTYEGSYNPNPDPSLYNFDVERDRTNPIACEALKRLEAVYGSNLSHYTEELSQSVIETGISSTTGYVLPEIEYIPGAVPGKSYKGYVPYKGYVMGGNPYSKTIGSYTYTKTDSGKIYNRFGVDVTDVDGVMSPMESKLARVFANDLHATQKSHGAPNAKVYFDPAMQMAAEAALAEAKENINNLTMAGVCSHAGSFSNSAAAAVRVALTRDVVERSKTTDFANNSQAWNELGSNLQTGYLMGIDDEYMQDTWAGNEGGDLSSAAFTEYFGGFQTRKRFNYYNYYGASNVEIQGIFGSESIRYPVSTYKDYITMLCACQADNDLDRFVRLNHNQHDLAFGLAYDEATSQIYVMVSALQKQDGTSLLGVLNDFYTQG